MFKKILKAFGKTILFTLYFSINILANILDWIANTLLGICRDNGIFTTYEKEHVATFDKKFSDKQITEMAKNLPEKTTNLKDIQSYFSVSYRQARLIKSAVSRLKSMPTIHGVSTVTA